MIKSRSNSIFKSIKQAVKSKERLLSILIDPDKFDLSKTEAFLNRIPDSTNYLLVGGSEVKNEHTEVVISQLKKCTQLPLILFPGDVNQITDQADAILFLSLLSGRNPEYLINQQVKSISKLQHSSLEIIPTGYILVDGGVSTSVLEVSQTKAIPQDQISSVVHTALAGQFSGKQLIYLEAGSGATHPVSAEIISEVKKNISIPLIVGGGIKTELQKETAYSAGADMVVMGNVFERL
ncbi:geranylgeranylglyceryl/heptaprenylglyceryl phosphate synthase [Psychroflexus sp. CAK57W]|uniref:geranylgeranylglyceryl/heptaprenylglyceryl phosphate synthase n=1 Tax=Psychroflexus curvus TaxID=2873595 RepID=UPI001CC9CF70|nr:geranylgeranylglyceryl/heptaprenylglyceryl phosphate synthase [Psychroflexus curvus]MBZ9788294.1 geranylgeranylglyceryl/heptaprenylglyceryl phosphate synthase [Psychroflexus curvus]